MTDYVRYLTRRHYGRIDMAGGLLLGYLLGVHPLWWGTWAVFLASVMFGPRYLSSALRHLYGQQEEEL
jgi:hypothetical protein